MKYLIVKCWELSDQYECEANKEPWRVVDDWKANAPKDTYFEVYEIHEDGSLKLIKEYDTAIEDGMIFGWYDREENLHVFKRYKNRTRKDRVPDRVKKFFHERRERQEGKVYNDLTSCGHITWWDASNDSVYFYAEYFDDDICYC